MAPTRIVIPLRVDGDGRAPVTRALAALNLLAFAALWAQGPAADGLVRRLGWVPARLASAESWRVLGPVEQLGPLLTHGFLHLGGLHLLGNLWALWVFGRAVERRIGPGPFVGLYLGALTLAALAQGLAQPGSVVPMIGASGAVAGLLGACLALSPGARVLTLVPLPIPTTARVPVWALVGAWAGLQLLAAAATAGSETAVAWWAHVAGLLVGGAAGLALRLPRRIGRSFFLRPPDPRTAR